MGLWEQVKGLCAKITSNKRKRNENDEPEEGEITTPVSKCFFSVFYKMILCKITCLPFSSLTNRPRISIFLFFIYRYFDGRIKAIDGTG